MTPTRQQKIAKAKFWQRIKSNQALLPDEMDDHEIARVSGCLELQLALKKVEFREWFLDASINQAMLEVGVDAAIKRLIDICEMTGADLIGKDAEAKTSDQVRAAEILLRYAGYAPGTAKADSAKDINNMTSHELDSFIDSKVRKLKKT